VFVWDERKREANLIKHKLDFDDAHLVFEDRDVFVEDLPYEREHRYSAIAVVKLFRAYVTVIFTPRGQDIRIISFRPASREERERYEQNRLGSSQKSR
jgi:uncharacterized DUF497 family protein